MTSNAPSPKPRRNLTRLQRWLGGMVGLGVSLGLAVMGFNWLGKRAYERDRTRVEAEGRSYDFLKVLPKPPPDEQNMVRIPIFAVVSDYSRTNGRPVWPAQDKNNRVMSRSVLSISKTDPKSLVSGKWELQKVTDLSLWQNYYRTYTNNILPKTPGRKHRDAWREANGLDDGYPLPERAGTPAQDVLAALSISSQELQQLRAAARLPYGQFPLHLHADEGFEMLLPHLACVKKICSYLSLHGIASLANGDSASAFEDLKIGYRLIGAIKNDSILVSEQVAYACNRIMTQVIYDGLRDDHWNAVELEKIQALASSVDFRKGYVDGLRGERAFANQQVLGWANGACGLDNLEGVGIFAGKSFLPLVPKGWYYYNLVRINRYFRQAIQNAETNPDTSISQAEDRLAATLASKDWDATLLRRVVHADSDAGTKDAERAGFRRAQAEVNLASTACALERFKLEYHKYPTELNVMVPRFLSAVPIDPFDGQALRYKAGLDGSFVLYSIGPDLLDQGGLVTLNKSGAVLDPNHGDFVWSYKPL